VQSKIDWFQPVHHNEPAVLLGFGLGLLSGHVVDHLLYPMNVAHEFGGQILFSSVLGLTPQLDDAFRRFDRGGKDAGRAMIQQRRLDQAGDGRIINCSE
jgi:hypothetical protein